MERAHEHCLQLSFACDYFRGIVVIVTKCHQSVILFNVDIFFFSVFSVQFGGQHLLVFADNGIASQHQLSIINMQGLHADNDQLLRPSAVEYDESYQHLDDELRFRFYLDLERCTVIFVGKKACVL